MKKKKHLESIIQFLSLWNNEIILSNAISFYDINKCSEGLVREILNTLFSLELKDLNNEDYNFPAIDLGDIKNKVAVQVTTRNDFSKIEE